MALTKTPVCDFGKKAEEFKLKSINNKLISLDDIKGVRRAHDLNYSLSNDHGSEKCYFSIALALIII